MIKLRLLKKYMKLILATAYEVYKEAVKKDYSY